MQTILLTGASGFIGSHIRAKLLTEKRFKLISIVRKEPAFLPSEREMIIQGDFYDPSVLQNIQQPVDCIIHCAAIRGEQSIPDFEYEKVNVDGTEALLDFAREKRIPRFIYLSSVGVLGTIPDPQPAKPEQPPQPDGKYHRSKWRAEELVRRFHSSALQTLILRPTITYGRGDNGFMYKLIRMVARRRFVFPLNTVYLHVLSVTSLAEWLPRLLSEGLFDGKTYHLADARPVSLKAVVDAISMEREGIPYPAYLRIPGAVFSIAGKMLRIIKEHSLLTSIRLISESWTYDISKTRARLNYQPADTMEMLKQQLKEM